ncbi:restriction endonuclease subunit S [Vibrio parahaemolyticus]|uniref:restriction endonuclease subunit S n=1 Tax=Vibrio vulnificus TaxID=672 RepID=UPI0004F8BF9F|nr:restriction endonuclease subunit S [Vibrio vulnificus]MDF5053513.1 restriction endonuclease subunit S [Vibrio parahaemolyticus]AIL72064.1 restriction endonuclease subunit S [Vibrio vulnificus]MDF5113609.1 restriction endonuclease subunit S [Vibrio parahaemolyticus]MDF5128564.1 restriction endonuclease subunit S [Vibrio parahaemolyticus]MDF5133564.1 restriction endonuclease subunit S [Vibrio parahaemolyticus]
MEQVLYKLPDGWEWHSVKKLSHNIQYGHTAKAESNGNAKFLRITDIQDGKIDWQGVPTVSLEKKEINKYALNDDDLIFARSGATAGKSILIKNAPKDAVFASYLIRIVPNKKYIIPEYLSYFFLTPAYWEVVGQNAAGAAQPNINGTKLSEFIVPVAPQGEQKRIVEKLGALLTRIDTAIEHLQESVTLADVLVKSSLSSMLTKQEHWDKVSLSDVCQITSKLCDPREEQYLDMFHVGGANITSFSGELIDLKTARDEKLISGKFPFDNSMVLYSKIRPYLMKVARPSFSGICSADIYPLTPDNQKMSRDFLFYLLLSDLFTQYAIEGSSRAGMPKVNRNHLFNFEFYLPPIDEQKSICESLDALVEKTNEVSKELTGKLSYLAGLKASILDSAFKGEL